MRTTHIASLGLSASLLLLALRPPAHSVEGPSFARYAVAADHTEASAAGASILAQGGNAADAAAATMLALGVVSPTSSGLGGGGFALYYRARDRKLSMLDFRETAPRAATPSMYAAQPGDTPEQTKQRSQRGGLAVGVPGEPLGIAELVRRFGKKPLAFSVRPAEQLAREGFLVSDHTRRMIGFVRDLLGRDALFNEVFGPALNGEKQAKNTALADTLQQFGKQGPKLFYTGALAPQIVAAVKQAGGILTAADLAQYRVVERKPIEQAVLGYRFTSAALPSAGGYTVLSSLAFLEQTLKPEQLASFGVERAHALIESWKGPYLDRQRYFGDPDHVAVKLDALRDPARLRTRAERFSPSQVAPPGAYDLPLPEPTAKAKPHGDRGTSHLCVVDAEGNVASVTTTVNLVFGAGVNVAGLWLNNEMDDFAREVGKENAFGLVGGAPNLPGAKKRPVSSMSPSIVFEGDKPILCVGGSGGSRIPTAVEQVALYVLKDGLHPTAAAAAPRLHHQADPDRVEGRGLSEPLVQALKQRGHNVTTANFSAHVQAIRIGAEGPARLLAGSDPNKGGEPRGE
jgi:gamma-glutamyltranspeptidase/glutathione hydrolase